MLLLDFTSLLTPGHIYLVAVSELPTDFSDLIDEVARYDTLRHCQHRVDPTSPNTITFKFPDTALLNRVYSDTHVGKLRTYAHCYALTFFSKNEFYSVESISTP